MKRTLMMGLAAIAACTLDRLYDSIEAYDFGIRLQGAAQGQRPPMRGFDRVQEGLTKSRHAAFVRNHVGKSVLRNTRSGAGTLPRSRRAPKPLAT